MFTDHGHQVCGGRGMFTGHVCGGRGVARMFRDHGHQHTSLSTPRSARAWDANGAGADRRVRGGERKCEQGATEWGRAEAMRGWWACAACKRLMLMDHGHQRTWRARVSLN